MYMQKKENRVRRSVSWEVAQQSSLILKVERVSASWTYTDSWFNKRGV